MIPCSIQTNFIKKLGKKNSCYATGHQWTTDSSSTSFSCKRKIHTIPIVFRVLVGVFIMKLFGNTDNTCPFLNNVMINEITVRITLFSSLKIAKIQNHISKHIVCFVSMVANGHTKLFLSCPTRVVDVYTQRRKRKDGNNNLSL